ncbi:probable threonine--tRNA ligase, cytoplasmic [Selaginella moellendorffii]|uniref:probable threonine--tRNA ligase, cytoplasmic n=1 Tax=Selaginella moellendorffii TaxID=88036 RepID=UPI000D1CBD6A|nr:probable threonine--tRNA ligase, cytoplasmic [Selaginella moellendorffii]|eukprot:XP_024543699.1 probable threonine--tRNA ligase, cytoplasmic [Selaginella moellendorffii]
MADPVVIQKRIRIFSELQASERARNEELGGQPIDVTVCKDGEVVYPGRRLLTTPLDIARLISKKKAADYVIAQGRDTFWHSSAHILGESLEQAYGCKLCIGPCTTRGEGFYYDAFYEDGRTLNEENFPAVQSQVTKAVQVRRGI